MAIAVAVIIEHDVIIVQSKPTNPRKGGVSCLPQRQKCSPLSNLCSPVIMIINIMIWTMKLCTDHPPIATVSKMSSVSKPDKPVPGLELGLVIFNIVKAL